MKADDTRDDPGPRKEETTMDIYDEIKTERTKQDKKWGGPDHDDTHGIEDWVGFINGHADRALVTGEGDVVMRYQLVRVAALAVAAVESLDRGGPQEVEGR